jgi:hypothetical protein
MPHRLRDLPWDRATVTTAAVFHAVMAMVIVLAPREIVVTDGTLPVFQMAPREAWAVLFAVAGVAAFLLAIKVTITRQLVTWFTIVPLGFAWTYAFADAVIAGRGSAIALLVWLTLLAVWSISAVRIALHTELPRQG